MKNLILTIAALVVGATFAPALAAGGGGDAGGAEIQAIDPVAIGLHLSDDEPCGMKRLHLDLALMGDGVAALEDLNPLFADRINQHFSGMEFAETKEKGFAAKLKHDLLDVINEALGPDKHIDEVLIQKMVVQ